jgi:hypothetical protein
VRLDHPSNERPRVAAKSTYLFRGAIRCVSCSRKMEGAKRKYAVFYRCAARTLVPGSAAAKGHPPTVYLREDQLAAKINEWVARLFAPGNLDEAAAILTGAQEGSDPAVATEDVFRRSIEVADAAMTRLQRAHESGWDPEALTEQYNAAVAEKKAADARLEAVGPSERLTAGELRAMVDRLGDIERVLAQA